MNVVHVHASCFTYFVVVNFKMFLNINYNVLGNFLIFIDFVIFS
jgi:hypothetical protein